MRHPSDSIKNAVSPVIFVACCAMIAYVTFLLVRGGLGSGVLEPGPIAEILLITVAVLVIAVWGTIFAIGFQLLMISRDPEANVGAACLQPSTSGESSLPTCRRDMYAVLALVFQKPSRPPAYARLASMLEEASGRLVANHGWDLGPPRGQTWALPPESLEAIEQDYMILFYGPQSVVSPPYESVYTSRGRRLMDRAAEDVVAAYRDAGFRLKETYRDCPDHIAAELEFMAHLCEKERQAAEEDPSLAEQHRHVQVSFLEGHLCRWIPAFSADVRQHTSTPFWKMVADLLERFVMQDTIRSQEFYPADQAQQRPPV